MKSETGVELMQKYMAMMSKDVAIKSMHTAIIFAIFQIAVTAKAVRTVNISRSQVMAIAHIRGIATYHKYLKELVGMGYLKYEPSYHPRYGSSISFCL